MSDGKQGQPQDNSEKFEMMKAALTKEIKKIDVDGVPTSITQLDLESTHWRQFAVTVLKEEDEEGYAEYRRRKYGEGDDAVEKPDLKQRKLAYLYAVTRFLDLSYTATTPESPTKLQVAGEMWRQRAVTFLRVLDPEAYATYRERKYGTGDDKIDNPDFAQRKKAYRFAMRRFLQKSYRHAGF
jgi:hypothetical protein